MSLTTRVVLVVMALCVLQSLGDWLVQRCFLLPEFADLERAEALEHLARCRNALEYEKDQLDILVADWAYWDDTYEFVQNPSSDYVRSNLVPTTFSDSKLDLIFIVAADGRVVYGKVLDPVSRKPIRLAAFPQDQWPPDHLFMSCARTGKSVSGGLGTPGGGMVVSARPVLTSRNAGPPRGVLVMGRFLTPVRVSSLAKLISLDVELWAASSARVPLRLRTALGQLASSSTEAVITTDGGKVTACSLLWDLRGRPGLLMCVHFPANITRRGEAVERFGMGMGIARALTLLVALLLIVRLMVLDPIERLAGQMEAVGETGDLELRLNSTRPDELGRVAREFDRMLASLSHAREGLSRQREELQGTNARLSAEIEERRSAQARLEAYRAELQALASRLATTEEEERRRLSVVLHDGVCQLIAAAKLQLQIAQVSAEDDGQLEVVQKAGEFLDEAIAEARRLSFELSPPVLHELGLPQALAWLAEQMTSQGLHTSVTGHSDLGALPAEVAATLFQAARELLMNALKHSQASAATVRIRRTEGGVSVEVGDDGVGFSPSMDPGQANGVNGFGLISVRERMRHIGGALSITSEPGRGTCALLTAPVDWQQNEGG